jgi:hypothetical protein
VTFPVKIKDVKKFEYINNVSINLCGIDKSNQIHPLKVVKFEKDNHLDLLIVDDGYDWHYVYITNFDRLVRSQITKRMNRVCICKRFFTHFDDRYGQTAPYKLHIHKTNCKSNAPLRIQLPSKQPFIKFENVGRQLRVPIVIYADFESILKPIDGNNPSPDVSYTQEY